MAQTISQRTGMRASEYYSDRKVRFMFEISKIELLAAKTGDQDFDLEDVRFCLNCERFYDAEYFIATIEHECDVAWVCSRCADEFEKYNDDAKRDVLERIERNFQFHRQELKSARIEAATR